MEMRRLSRFSLPYSISLAIYLEMLRSRGARLRDQMAAGLAILAVSCGVQAQASEPEDLEPSTNTIAATSEIKESAGEALLTLEECLRLADADNPDIRSARSDVAVKQAAVGIAFAGFLPRLDLQPSIYMQELRYLKTKQVFLSGTSVQLSPIIHDSFFAPLKFTLNQTLLDFGKTHQGYEKALHELRAVQWTLEAVRAQVFLTVKTAFINTLRNQQALAISDQALAQRKLVVKISEDLYQAGMRPRLDSIRAEIDLENARLQRVDFEMGLGRAWKSLETAVSAASLSARPLENILTKDDLQLSESETQTATRIHRPEILSQKELVEAQTHSRGVGRRRFLPTLSGLATYSARQQTSVSGRFQGFQRHWYLGANASLNLFNGLADMASVKSAQSALEKAQSDLLSLQNNASSEAFGALIDAAGLQKKLKNSARLEDLARESEKLALMLYRNGKGTMLQVTDVQNQLLSARLTRLGNLADYRLALFRLERATGTPLTALGRKAP